MRFRVAFKIGNSAVLYTEWYDSVEDSWVFVHHASHTDSVFALRVEDEMGNVI